MGEGVVDTSVGAGEVTQDDKLWALLCWIIGVIVPVVVLLMEDKKDRPFLKYNAVLSLAFSVAWMIIGTITIGCGGVLGLFYAIYLGIKAYQGEWVQVPLLTDFCKNQGWI